MLTPVRLQLIQGADGLFRPDQTAYDAEPMRTDGAFLMPLASPAANIWANRIFHLAYIRENAYNVKR